LVAGVMVLTLGASAARSAAPVAASPPAAVHLRPMSFWADKFLESWPRHQRAE
jgi:hypothetical protein